LVPEEGLQVLDAHAGESKAVSGIKYAEDGVRLADDALLEHYHGTLREDDHGTAIDSDVCVCVATPSRSLFSRRS
jgi:hypothetical protein